MNIEQEIEKKAKELIKARRKLFIIKFISKSNSSICQECEDFGVPKSTFYSWRKRYELEGYDVLHSILKQLLEEAWAKRPPTLAISHA
jgi:transposase